MEVTVDVKFTYTVSGIDQVVKNMDLMTKFKGENNENFSYIQHSTGSEIQADPQWSGIQDGVTFTVKNKSFSNVKEATELLTKMIESVLETIKTTMSSMKIPSSAMSETHEIATVKCGICNRSHKSNMQDFEKHVHSHDTTPQAIDLKELVHNLAKKEPGEYSSSFSQDNEYRHLPFGSKAIKKEPEERDVKPYRSFGSATADATRESSRWDKLWDSDRKERNGSSFRSRSHDRRSRSRSRDRRRNRSRSPGHRRNRSRSRDRYQRSWSNERSPYKKRGHSRSPSSTFDKKRKHGSTDFGSRRFAAGVGAEDKKGSKSVTGNFLYSDISDQMIENPSPAEPAYVASARLQILTAQRENGQLKDAECRMLVDSFMWSLTHFDKIFVSGLCQSEEKAARHHRGFVSKSRQLTTELKAVCKFFISRSEQSQSNNIDKYPFAEQMKNGTGKYTRTRDVRISSKGPKASEEKDQSKLGLTQEEIENPLGEPVYKSLRRRTILEQQRKERQLSNGKMRDLILKLRTSGNEALQKIYTDRRLQKMNIPVYGQPTESQRLEAELFGLCDMIIDRNEEGEQATGKLKLSEIEAPIVGESVDVAVKRRDTLMAARKAGSLVNRQMKEYIKDFMVPMTNSEKQAVLEKMIQFKKNSPQFPTPGAELTEKLRIVCEHFVDIARRREMLLTGGQSTVFQSVIGPEVASESASSRFNTAELSGGKESKPYPMPAAPPPWLAKSAPEQMPAGSFNGATPQVQGEGKYELGVDSTTQYIIMNPHVAEPRYVSVGRERVLKKFQENAARNFDTDSMGAILNNLKSVIPHLEMNGALLIVGEILRSKSVPSLDFMTKIQQLGTRLQAICQYYVRRNEQERENAGPYPLERLLSKLNHPDFNQSKGGQIDVVHRIMMKPHPAEPEYISQGRFKKLTADRRSGNLDNTSLEGVLKDMRDSIPQQDKDMIGQILNEEVRKVGMSFPSLNRTQQLDGLLKNTCLYYARKTWQERQAAGPYPLAHLLSQIDHPDFKPAGNLRDTTSTQMPEQAVEKTQEFEYSDLSEFFVRNPCSSEPEIVSKGRFKKLETQFLSKFSSANPEEIANVARDIKNVLTQKDKDAISQAFTRALSLQRGSTVSSECLQLKAICEHFLKLTDTERKRNGPYPHIHLLNKFIRTKKDSQLRGTSRNGQYSSRYADFFKKLDVVKKLVGALAEQNNVNYEFNVTTTSKSQYQATVTIGKTEFKETSTISAYQATSMAIYQALMKTEYAFHKIPDGLKSHKPENVASKVIVRSMDPAQSARMLVKVLQQQTNENVRYTWKTELFCYAVNLNIGTESYVGTGLTEEAAKAMADFYAIQQTSYDFQEVPPGVAIGYQGEKYRVVESPYSTIIQKRRQFQEGADMMMTDEFTSLVIGEIEQKAKLGPQDTALVNRKIDMLAQMVPKTPAWEEYWKVLVVTKKLEYTCDLVLKRESNINFLVGNWLDETKLDPDLRKGVQPTMGVRLPWIPELEPTISLSQAPIQDRYEAMKEKIGQLITKRKNNTLRDQNALALMDSIRRHLPKEMLAQVDQRYEKANIGDIGTATPESFKVTMRLTILVHFLLERLEKQMKATDKATSNVHGSSDGTLYNRMMRNY